jgi:hypothetical protein
MTKKEILELIAKYKKMHAEYKKAFYENGIDANEQQQLDSLEAKIKDLEKLLEVANSEESPMITKNESLTKVTSADANNDNDDWEKILIDWLEKNKVEILKTFTAPSKDKLKEEFINIDLTSAEDKITKLIKQFQGDMREKSPSVPNEYLRTAIKKWFKNNDVHLLTTFDESTIKWTEPTITWLEKNGTYFQMRLDTTLNSPVGDVKSYMQSLKKHVKLIKSAVIEAAQIPDSKIETFLKEWLINYNDQFFILFFEKNNNELKLQSVENIFSGLKEIGSFDWDFSGGKLYLKAGGKALNVTAATGFEIDSDGNLVPKVGGDVKTDIKIIDNVSTNIKLGLEHKEGKTKGKIQVGTKIKAPILKGDIELKFDIDTKKTWGFQLAFTSKGDGHLSKKAVELTNRTMMSAAKAMDEIYSGELSEAEIYDRIDKINIDIDKLNKALQEPIDKKENIAFSFGVSGDKYGNVTFGAGIIIRF